MNLRKYATLTGIGITIGITAVMLAAAMVGSARAGEPVPAPEIDPSLVTGTLTVLAGGGLMLVERIRRR